jgi:hypothetical protein
MAGLRKNHTEPALPRLEWGMRVFQDAQPYVPHASMAYPSLELIESSETGK